METTTQKKQNYTEAEFGKQHWSLLAFIETQVVDKCFPLDHRRMSCNEKKRGISNGAPFGWKNEWSTENKEGKQEILGHDDIDCFEELEKEGYIKNQGTLLNMYPLITDKGWKACAELRKFKGQGGNFINFRFSEIEKETQYKHFDTVFKNKTSGQFVRLGSDEHSPLGYYPCDESGSYTNGQMIDGTFEVEKQTEWELFKKI